MKFILGIILSYLIGSVPTAYIFGKMYKGIDIRQHGSGNVGATNVFRVLGKGPGILVLTLDILKGVLAVSLVARMFNITSAWQLIVLACAVVSGHNWTVFLQFKGGKGVATSLGALIGLAVQIPAILPVLLITVFIWLGCFVLSGFVSLASIVATTFLPILMLLTNQTFEIVVLGVIFCLFVVIRHRPNIKRLLSGQEPKVPIFFHKSKSV